MGKKLSDWLDDRRAMPGGQVLLSDEAVAALRALGPEAVPTLLTWLGTSRAATGAPGMTIAVNVETAFLPS